MESTGAYHAAQAVVTALLQGAQPAEVVVDGDGYGDWTPFIQNLVALHAQGGTSAVVRAFDALARADHAIAALVAGSPPLRVIIAHGAPSLPPDLAAVCTDAPHGDTWLDAYVTFARRAAPMTPPAFHEAAGLFLVSTVIARRLVYRTGTDGLYPNLFLIEIADPAEYKKTTGLRVARAVLDAAGLTYLLLAENVTPQGLSEELSLHVSPQIEQFDDERRAEWLRERAFAAQRAWLIDEAAALFDSFEREFNIGLHLLILRLFDCDGLLRDRTATRGRATVKQAYLSLLGATTPETLRKHLNSRLLWGSGLWSRFVFVTPDTESVYAPRPPHLPIPATLVQGLRRIFELFPVPDATWHEDQDDEGRRSGTPRVVLHNQQEAAATTFAPGVEALLDQYSEVIGFQFPKQGLIDTTLRSSYDRMGTHLLKVAMLLAVLDAPCLPIVVERRHAARALQIVERWRRCLHTVWESMSATDEAHLTHKILEYLQRAHPHGLTARELCQATHRLSEDVRRALALLHEAGQVDKVPVGKTVRWLCAMPNADVAPVAARSSGDATPNTAAQSPEG